MVEKRLLCFAVFLMLSGVGRAASRDSLIIHVGADGWELPHKIQPGETVFSIARRFSVPPAILAEANGLNYQDGAVKAGSTLYVPLGSYNMVSVQPLRLDSVKPLYYRFTASDRLSRICRTASISQQTLAQWNSLPPGTAQIGRALMVGWVRWSPQIMTAVSPVPPSIKKDTPKYVFQPVDTASTVSKADVPLTLRELWHEQTLDGQNVVTEKGSAGFFSINVRSPRAAEYAFHNAAARGTVIKVRNLNNGRTIYVKVSGPLPETKQYAGCILGLSNGAKAALGVQENKAFCELSYAGY